jgi:hypothetical protein
MELVRWNDERLDDLAQEVRRNADVREQIVQLRAQVQTASETAGRAVVKLEELEEHLAESARTQHRERVSDRRWMIATLLTTAGLVIAALGIFLG